MYQCKLQIEGLYRKLSTEDGLNLKDLSDLLVKLSKALDKKSRSFTLTKIENSSYSPILETDNLEVVDEFDNIHRAISTIEVERLPAEYQEYAQALNRILFTNNLYITAKNPRNEEGVKITQVNKLSSNQYYFSINSISGKIIALYGRNEKDPFIAIRTSRNEDYSIHIRPEDEKALSSFYKDLNVKLRIRVKVDVKDGKVLHAELIDYTIPTEGGFLASIKKIQEQYGDIFSNINDSARKLREIRGMHD